MDPRPQTAVSGTHSSAADPRKTNKIDSFRNVQEPARRLPYDGLSGDEVVAPVHELCGRQGLLADESKMNEATAGDSRHGQSLRRRANPLLHNFLEAKTQAQINASGDKTKARVTGSKAKAHVAGDKAKVRVTSHIRWICCRFRKLNTTSKSDCITCSRRHKSVNTH